MISPNKKGGGTMTIQEVVMNLQEEKKANIPSRFPCRAIMVRNIRQYCDLLSELKKISDIRVLQTQELFTNADIMPKYENLKADKYRDQWIILTGVSEYLRLFSKSEMDDRRFAGLWSYQAPSNNIGRIIIPLWGCETQWFDKALHLAGDLRQQDFYYDCTDASLEEQDMKLLVLSGKLEKYISNLEALRGDLKIGLQDWFEYWMDPVPEKSEFVLLTKRFGSVVATNGSISIRVISDTLNLIQENMQGASVLSPTNCNDEMQGILLDYALKGLSLDSALLRILNMSSFSGIDVMGKWKALDDNHKMFVNMWYKLHPDNTYLCSCFSACDDIGNLLDVVMLNIFKVWSDKRDWVQEYRELIKVIGIIPDARFFNELEKIPVYEQRLDFMTGTSREEQIYLLRMAGKWMRTDYNQTLASEKLKATYPELFAYLNDEDLPIDSEIKHYMSKYKAYKLENTLPEDDEIYFNGIQTDIYDMRYSVLSDYIDDEVIVLWIDAMGIEWLPILNWSLSNNCDANIIKVAIGQANLPTETEFNDQWKRMSCPHNKLDKLDKLAHKGVVDEPDYYVCVQEQLAFIANIYRKVTELMEEHHRVIITGDHGTSRLAARMFHKRDGMPLPKNATARSHGRYCLLSNRSADSIPNTVVKEVDGNQYVIFQNYDHFTQSGFAAGADDENAIYGEIHGGASPEEMLVPIIVLDSNRDITISGKWEKETVKISMKKVRLHIDFNKPVYHLQARMDGVDGETIIDADSKSWNIIFRGIGPGSYPVQVFANNKIITMPSVTVQPALGGGEGDLPI